MQNRITVLAPINTFTGYGLHAVQIIRDLSKFAHVSVRSIVTSELFGAKVPPDIQKKFVQEPQPEPWEVLLHPPNFMPTHGKKTAYFSMWESTKLPTQASYFLNRASVVVVPCKWNETLFSASGVTAPIRVVPLGINTHIFGYRPRPENTPVTFGAAGRMAHGGVRKGINEVIDCFLRAFPTEQDVRLKIKCFPDCDVKHVKDPRVQITQAHLSEMQLADWFGSLSCFVSAARGEGWGLMQHQAMAMGRPVITVNFGGVTEFFRSDLGYAVDYKLEQASGHYAGCGHWALPDFEHVEHLMRRVYENPMEAETKGFLASQHVAPLSWEHSNGKLAEVLHEFGAL